MSNKWKMSDKIRCFCIHLRGPVGAPSHMNVHGCALHDVDVNRRRRMSRSHFPPMSNSTSLRVLPNETTSQIIFYLKKKKHHYATRRHVFKRKSNNYEQTLPSSVQSDKTTLPELSCRKTYAQSDWLISIIRLSDWRRCILIVVARSYCYSQRRVFSKISNSQFENKNVGWIVCFSTY